MSCPGMTATFVCDLQVKALVQVGLEEAHYISNLASRVGGVGSVIPEPCSNPDSKTGIAGRLDKCMG